MLLIQRPEIKALDEESKNKQRFLISPLDPGFGHTLGNSLRRTLLSAIPGAAITHVLFDNAIHEFDVIEGVIEDVPDVLLNIKDIVVSSESESRIASSRCKHTGRSNCIQFVANADVEIHNELVTSNLKWVWVSGNGSHCSTRKRVYLSRCQQEGNTSTTQVAVDSVFSPVRRVTFSEPTRVEQSNDFDALTIEIETDGSMAPADAFASAGGTLGNLVQLVADWSEEPQGLELTEIVTGTSGSPDLELPIEDLELSEQLFQVIA